MPQLRPITEEDVKALVSGLRRFAARQAQTIAKKAAEGIKARTWAGLDEEGNLFTALEPDYAAWKRKAAPGMPILFFLPAMVDALEVTATIEWKSPDIVEPVITTEIPEGVMDENGVELAYKQWVHEERGVDRLDMPFSVIRKFSGVGDDLREELRDQFRADLVKWAQDALRKRKII